MAHRAFGGKQTKGSHMNKHSQKSQLGVRVAVALAALAVVFLTVWWLQPAIITGLWSVFRSSWVVLIPTVALLTVGCILLLRLEKVRAGTLLLIAGIAWCIGGGVGLHYFQLQAVNDASIVRTSEPPNSLSFRERAPYDVADATSSRTLGKTTGDVSGKIRSIPAAGDTGEYTTSVIRRGMFQGYESTQTLTPPLYGTADASDVTFCDFDPHAKLRFGGFWPVNNLQTAIYHMTPVGTNADRGDAFVVCDGDIPKVYAPLTRQEGFAVTVRVPAGVAIYNGKTGELTIEQDYSGKLPVYPQSVTKVQRISTTASGSLLDYWFSRVGWEDTGKDESDPNGANRAEFGLSDLDGGKQLYVTPLNPRGSSSSIVALGVGEASTMTAGEFNDFTVYSYAGDEVRQANSSVADAITGGVLQGYQAEALSVFEVVPAKDGDWSAMIGKKQSILYRATVAVDGSIALRDALGKQVGGEVTVGADGEVDREAAKDSTVGQLNDDELRDLGQQVIEELAKRAAK